MSEAEAQHSPRAGTSRIPTLPVTLLQFSVCAQMLLTALPVRTGLCSCVRSFNKGIIELLVCSRCLSRVLSCCHSHRYFSTKSPHPLFNLLCFSWDPDQPLMVASGPQTALLTYCIWISPCVITKGNCISITLGKCIDEPDFCSSRSPFPSYMWGS